MSRKSPDQNDGAHGPTQPQISATSQTGDIASLVGAVLEAHERHQDALKNGTSFTANPSPQLSPHNGPSTNHAFSPILSTSDTTAGEVRSSGSGSVQEPHLVTVGPTGLTSSGTWRASAGPLLVPTNKSQGDISDSGGGFVPNSGRSTTTISVRGSVDYGSMMMTDPIVDLGKAATELYLALGGGNHKKHATTLLLALERTLDLIQGSAALLQSMNLIPLAEVMAHAEKFVLLMSDAKDLFMASQQQSSRIGAHSTSPGGRSDLLTPPFGGANPLSPSRRENTGTYPPVIGASSTERKQQQHQQQQPIPLKGPTTIAEDELYDVTLLLKGASPSRSLPGGGNSSSPSGGVSPGGSNSRDPEVDDEMLALKSRIQSLSLQKRQLESHVERLEIQLKKQAENVSKETAALRTQHKEMEKDLAWMTTQVEKGVWLPTYSGSPTKKLAGNAGSSPNQHQTPHRRTEREGEAPRSPLDAPQDPDEESPSQSNQSSPHHAGGRYHSSCSSVPMIAPNDVASFRANKMDALYADTYRGRGMEMVWNVLECVFKREFSGPSSPTATSGGAGGSSVAAENGGGTTPRSVGAAAAAKIGTPSDMALSSPTTNSSSAASYQTFVTAYRRKIGDVLEDQSKFNALMVETTPLRSDYVANCLGSKLKPNSGVVKLLTTINSDASVETLNLHSNYIGDGGLPPIIPLLTRLYRLKNLNLSDNGLKNGAIHQLCIALQRHPTIERVNVSNNPITRSGGKDLLTLASGSNNVFEVNCTGTQIESILQERIVHRTQLNRDSTKY